MHVFIRNTVLLVWVWLLLAGVCLGKQVYLTDGGIIECESFWRRGDQIVVKVNRDIVVDFDRSEIDVQRTFQPAVKKSVHRGLKMSAGSAQSVGVVTPAGTNSTMARPATSPAAHAAPAANPVPSPVPPPVVAAQETAPPEAAQPAAADPASPPDKAELERRSREAAAMMAEAIQKKDPELMKKAMDLQRNAMGQQGATTSQFGTKFMLMLLVVCLLIVVSMWAVFEKAGESGWKCLIPIYNLYILLMISGKPGWWLILMLIPLVGAVCYFLAMLALSERFGRGAVFGIGLFLLPMIFFPLLAFAGAPAERVEA